MAKKTKKAARKGRNRAAQDATLINLRALKKRAANMERAIEENFQCLLHVGRRTESLEKKDKLIRKWVFESLKFFEAIKDLIIELDERTTGSK